MRYVLGKKIAGFVGFFFLEPAECGNKDSCAKLTKANNAIMKSYVIKYKKENIEQNEIDTKTILKFCFSFNC